MTEKVKYKCHIDLSVLKFEDISTYGRENFYLSRNEKNIEYDINCLPFNINHIKKKIRDLNINVLSISERNDYIREYWIKISCNETKFIILKQSGFVHYYHQ